MKVIVVDINGTPHEIDQGINPDFNVLARWSGNRYLVLASNEGDLFDPLDINVNISKRDKERGKIAKTIQKGDFSVRINPTGSNDEIYQLSLAIDNMTETLQTQEKKENCYD